MKVKVLISQYTDKSGFDVLKVYLEKDFEQIDKDIDMLLLHSEDKELIIKDSII